MKILSPAMELHVVQQIVIGVSEERVVASLDCMMPSGLVDPYEIFGEPAPSNSLPTLQRHVLLPPEEGDLTFHRNADTICHIILRYKKVKLSL
jgi:hypothetical protein